MKRFEPWLESNSFGLLLRASLASVRFTALLRSCASLRARFGHQLT